MPDIEAPADDTLEQQQPTSGAEAVLGNPDEPGLEVSEADLAAQAAETAPQLSSSPPAELALEANAADVAEQSSEVGVDDEEYR